MTSIIQLDTTELKQAVSIYLFQFGTIAATEGTYKLLQKKVLNGLTDVSVFSVERNMNIPADQLIRFNLRFEIDNHNSAHLQLCLCQANPSDLAILSWRWVAPIGFMGKWSDELQQAPWSDGGEDYCIRITPNEDGIMVKLSEFSVTDRHKPWPVLPEFTPVDQAVQCPCKGAKHI